MIEPTRLLDETGGDPLEASLLRLARSEAPSPDSRRRIIAGFAAAGVATTIATQTAGAAKAGASSVAAGLKWGLLGMAALALPSALLLRGSDDKTLTLDHTAPPSALQAPATEVKPTITPTEADGPAPLKLEDLPALPPTTEPVSGARAEQGSLADEVAQLQKAKLALRDGNPARALTELGVYGQRFPHPRLGAEATVVRIEALSASGDTARAKTLAEGFLGKNPNSPYATRLRSLTGAR